MGHQTLGRLPRTRRWREVVELLDRSPGETAAVAAAVTEAADFRFRQLANDPGLGYAIWLLARVSWAARGADFLGELRSLGIDTTHDATTLSVISQLSERIRAELSTSPSSGQFGEIATLAARRALTETVAQTGPSLFSSSIEDLQRAFRDYSTRTGFGDLAQHFFADFMARSLRSFVDRELATHVGEGALADVGASRDFMDALDLHSRQAARIVEDFAGGWYSKHNWESKGEVSQEEAQRFVAYALRKLRTELKRGAATA
jgi:hypothetical protein